MLIDEKITEYSLVLLNRAIIMKILIIFGLQSLFFILKRLNKHQCPVKHLTITLPLRTLPAAIYLHVNNETQSTYECTRPYLWNSSLKAK